MNIFKKYNCVLHVDLQTHAHAHTDRQVPLCPALFPRRASSRWLLHWNGDSSNIFFLGWTLCLVLQGTVGIFAVVGSVCRSSNSKLLNKGSNFQICMEILWQPFQETSALPRLCLGCSDHLKAFLQADNQWLLLPATLPLTAGLLLKPEMSNPHRETLPRHANKTESCHTQRLELWPNGIFCVYGKMLNYPRRAFLRWDRISPLHINKTKHKRVLYSKSFLLPGSELLVY